MATFNVTTLVLSFLVFSSTAHAQVTLPEVVERHLAEMAKTCRDAGGTPAKSPDLLIIADLTGDRLPDFVIDEGAFNCHGAASLYSGSGGSKVSVYVGVQSGPALRAFSSGSFGVKVDKAVKPPKLQIGVGGPLCGQSESLPRSEYKLCWRPVDWDERERRMYFAPVSRVTFIQ